jgi:hypothetical protein
VVDGLHGLVTEEALRSGFQAVPSPTIMGPLTLLERQPDKDFDPQWCPGFPDEGVTTELDHSNVKRGVGRLGGVRAIRSPPPYRLVRAVTEVDVLNGR